MKKMTRKTAVMLASAMIASAMMGTGVFADTITEEPEQPAQVPLTMTGSVDTYNPGASVHNDASLSKVWNVTINASGLNWQVAQTNNFTGGTYDINWNASTHKYVRTQTTGAGDYVSSTTTVVNADKTFSITNDSNFDLDYVVSLAEGANYTTYFDANTINTVFSITNGQNTVSSGNSSTVTLTMYPSTMKQQSGPDINASNFAYASINLTAETQYASNHSTYGLTTNG